MWLLLLLDAAERAGVTPLSVGRLHRLVYLANAMAPVYDILTPDGYILKYKRGPFFPAVQWDIDRLGAQGLARVANLQRAEDELGWWFDADYTLTKRGMGAVDAAKGLTEIAAKGSFLREVVKAFAAMELPEDERDAALLGDVAYAKADDQAPIDFRTASENLTSLAATAIAGKGYEGHQVSRRAEVHLYFRYLERLWARQSGARNSA
ncbi:MAG TPA: hypothetical protein VIJ94_01000 [Caulobacteraceae bacterium]